MYKVMRGDMKLKLAFFTFIVCCATAFAQGNSKFRVVLDAGHGGKDYGAVYHGFIEKNIALNVTLKVGKLLEKDPGVQVIYTRKTDVFIELKERPEIANKADANLFVSIHCNGEAKKAAYGTETFVMGATKNASSMEVAKKENSVIELEDDKRSYAGFDPNSPESFIGLVLQHEAFVNQSFDIASKVQASFTDDLERKNRGVKQAPFWVLHRTAMPSILVELGFISYKPEGEWLNSEQGQDKLAKSIADAILSYKKENFIAGNVDYHEPERVAEKPSAPVKEVKPKADPVKVDTKTDAETYADNKGEVVYKVQIASGGSNLPTTPSNFKGLNNISKSTEGTGYKYYYGETDEYAKAKQLLEEAKAKGYTSAFVVPFRNGKKITVQEALQKR
jgi:N-acetylmuramoyl-L-alanine amidase